MRKGIKQLFASPKNRFQNAYDYSSVYSRESAVKQLLRRAELAKSGVCEYWDRMRSYYDGTHDTSVFSNEFGTENSLPWACAQSTDGYIHVESQIEPDMPEFEFSPRGGDDSQKAKQREKVVRYICDRNNMNYKNSRNERRLGIYGSAVWKVCWDNNYREDGVCGEVIIDNPHPKEIFPDPTAACVDDCEYIGYVYSMHKEKARRTFAAELALRELDFNELIANSSNGNEYFPEENSLIGNFANSEVVQITEWWFRQPADGQTDITYFSDGSPKTAHYSYNAGDIGLCVLLNGVEVRYIPKYWNETNCTMFPFVIYDRLPRENTLWGKSELEAIIPFIDAADREIAYAQLNSAFSSNDIIIAEENALCDDCELENAPGAVWKLRPGMMGKVQRLGNSAYAESYLHSNYDKWKALMQETTGNFSINQGNEPQNVTTATGIALLNERAKNRSSLKKIDKSVGFKRLFELCDRTALEYYDDGRIVFCGAAQDGELIYRSGDYKRSLNGKTYIPTVDIKIHIGDGLANSKAFTISAINSLISTPITQDNYRIVKSYLELIDIPMRKEICDMLDEKFNNNGNNGNNGNGDSADSGETANLLYNSVLSQAENQKETE